MNKKNNNQLAKNLFQDHMDGMKQAFIKLDFEDYQKTNIYLRINKYTDQVSIATNNPILGGSTFIEIDSDYYVYKLPKIDFLEKDFEIKEILNIPLEKRSNLIMFASSYISLNEINEFVTVKDFVNSAFYMYFIQISDEYLTMITDVLRLLQKRVEIPRNLQFAEFARQFDLRIQRKLYF